MNTNNIPLISVIITTFNNEKYIEKAINSVFSQKNYHMEIIIIDDGSTDRTFDIIKKYDELRYFYQPNSGISSARNMGIHKSRGKFISFLDADDYFPPNKLKIHLDKFEAYPNMIAIMGKNQYFGNIDVSWLDSYNQSWNFHLGATLIRKKAFEIVGTFNESLNVYEDYDWFSRLLEQELPFGIINEVTLNYRRHDINITKQKKMCETELIKVRNLIAERKKNNPLLAEPQPLEYYLL